MFATALVVCYYKDSELVRCHSLQNVTIISFNLARLKTGYNLHTFDVSFNDLKILESGSLLANITHIYINNNNIANVSETSFLGLDGLRLVDAARVALQIEVQGFLGSEVCCWRAPPTPSRG